MRYYEIACGLRLPVSSEEQDLLDVVERDAPSNDDMDERQQELARLMVSRGVLHRQVKKGRLHFRPNSATNIWRDRDDS